VREGDLEGFLGALASGSPVPGGGAAAALAGALAAALVGMVARVTAARDPGASTAADLAAAADGLRRHLADLVGADSRAYAAVVQARGDLRSRPGQAALVGATEVPLRVVRESRRVLELCLTLAPTARASARADLGVAACLAWAALEAGALTARANLKDLADPAFVEAAGGELDRATREGARLRDDILRLGAGRS
jgi:formiminotetrahydrofolate cyclodeaminase